MSLSINPSQGAGPECSRKHDPGRAEAPQELVPRLWAGPRPCPQLHPLPGRSAPCPGQPRGAGGTPGPHPGLTCPPHLAAGKAPGIRLDQLNGPEMQSVCVLWVLGAAGLLFTVARRSVGHSDVVEGETQKAPGPREEQRSEHRQPRQRAQERTRQRTRQRTRYLKQTAPGEQFSFRAEVCSTNQKEE